MQPRMFFPLAVAALGLLPAVAVAELRLSSGPAQTAMIELFTSEGCNSCPPAEARLNAYASRDGLWTRYIPLAFHVDYWDSLGWKDRYAHPAHTRRQQHYAALGRLRTVYTPAFAVNGREWSPWRGGASPDAAGKPVGTLSLVLRGREIEARFMSIVAQAGALDLNLALLGMGLTTEIRAGENAGRKALHEFVVLAHSQQRTRDGRWRTVVPVPAETWGARAFALAAWVSRPGDPAPLQATGGELPATLLRAGPASPSQYR